MTMTSADRLSFAITRTSCGVSCQIALVSRQGSFDPCPAALPGSSGASVTALQRIQAVVPNGLRRHLSPKRLDNAWARFGKPYATRPGLALTCRTSAPPDMVAASVETEHDPELLIYGL